MSLVNIYANDDNRSLEIKNKVINELQKNNFEISEHFSDKAVLNICIGGDGTFLKAVHESNLSQIPFVGVNTGHLGFYQEILEENIASFIESFKNDNYMVTNLSLLTCQIENNEVMNTYYALNEFVLKTRNHSIIHLDVMINGYKLEKFAGDGVIISTPSGSTAYNFSVGGSILFQELDGYQLSPIAPINSRAYRSLPSSIVLPKDTKLNIEPYFRNMNQIDLIIDGNVLNTGSVSSYKFTFGDKNKETCL